MRRKMRRKTNLGLSKLQWSHVERPGVKPVLPDHPAILHVIIAIVRIHWENPSRHQVSLDLPWHSGRGSHISL